MKHLLALLDELPGESLVPVHWVRDALAAHPVEDNAVDFTADAVAERYGRTPAAVRTWCREGKLPGAYRLHGREWRIPAGALEALKGNNGKASGPAPEGGADLASWRRVGP